MSSIARKSKFALAALSALTVSLLTEELWRDSQNSLLAYPEWRSAKVDLSLGVTGAFSFLASSVALAGRSLNLAAWHGHQELRLERDWPGLPELRLRLRGGEFSVFYLIARPPGGGEGFAWRLSSNPRHPSAWIALGKNQEFSRKLALAEAFPVNRWVELSWRRQESGLGLFLDGKLMEKVPLPAGSWKLSLHGSSRSGQLLVDDLVIGRGQERYEQSFSGHFAWPAFVIVLLLSALSFALLCRTRVFTSFLLTAPLVALLALAAYRQVLAPRYPLRMEPLPFKSNIETQDEALNRLRVQPGEAREVVLWLGGSQAWGAGASDFAHTAVAQLERLLSRPLRARFQLVNGGISALQVKHQLRTFQTVAEKRKIAGVVLISGVNDAENPAFGQDLRLFAGEVRKAGAKLLFVAEPIENHSSNAVRFRHQELKDVAAEKGIRFFDLQEAISREEESGILWWDFVHFSDFGALKAAEALRPVVEKFLSSL